MNVTFACPQCDRTTRCRAHDQTLTCTHCGAALRVPESSVEQDQVRRCLVCPCSELFVRKDFPQRLGLLIIGLGFVASSIALAWHQQVISLAILIATAAVDAGLYMWMGNVLTCYRCHAEYRDVAGLEGHPGFRLDVHERYRQQAARLSETPASGEKRTPAQSPGA
jgi:hypothetical protein